MEQLQTKLIPPPSSGGGQEKRAEKRREKVPNRIKRTGSPTNHTYIICQQVKRRRKKVKGKCQSQAAGGGKQIAEEVGRRRFCEKEHYKRERLHCAELITPTPAFVNQKEEELNS